MPGFAEFLRHQVDSPWFGPAVDNRTITVEQLQANRLGLPGGQRSELPRGDAPGSDAGPHPCETG
jgi:hypothetical protein